MSSDTVLIIGGGPAGLEAARSVAGLGARAILVEQRQRLGGSPDAVGYAALTPDFRDAAAAMGEMVASVKDRPGIEIRTETTVSDCQGEAGDFVVTLQTGGGSEQVRAGAIIVATGFQHFDPGRATQMYGYYEFADVITIADLEPMLRQGRVQRPSNGEAPERVCFVQCVGSRDRQVGNPWCSKVCCGIACKQAVEIRQMLPDCRVFVFYIDLRAYGFWEPELYWQAQEQHRVNYIRGVVTEVLKKGDKLLVRGEDTTFNRPVEVTMDLVVLSVGMEPSQGTTDLARLFGLSLQHGWIAAGGPLDTVSTSRHGIFVAGAAAGPADLEDSVSTGGAAALKAVSLLRRRTAAAG